MKNAVAFADNDVATVAWSFGERPDGCMGFAVFRVDEDGKETPLPSHAVFKGSKIAPGQTTEEFPVQKFYWKDVFARLIAEKTGKRTFRYKIVPLEGKPGALQPMKKFPQLISNEVTLSATVSETTSAYFNRGLISTQRVSQALHGAPSKGELLKRVADATDPLRASLAGNMIGALTGFVARAKSTGTIFAALYELGDAELLKSLTDIGKRLQIVLASTVGTDPETGEKGDGNAASRAALEPTAGAKFDRLMPANHIAHNKFLVYQDREGTPQAVLLGSTNWTSTGLCTQTNNTMVIEDAKLAARYKAYWQQLAADTKAADGEPKSMQGAKLRAFDSKGQDFTLGDESALTSFVSPNTPKPRSSKKTGEKTPVDMAEVIKHVNAAKQAILFLVFYPGTPSIAQWSADAAKANKNLFVRGCVTNKSASEGFFYELRGTSPPRRAPGDKTPVKQDPRVIGAEALDGKTIPEGWMKEILNAGFAIIHDKIVVIDPFSDDCVVITGSHNLGFKASYDNDENLVIVQGNKALAAAYATHVLDVYDHFSWRYMVKQMGGKADASLASTPDEWLNRYFDANGEIKNAQLKFFLSANVS